MAEGTLRAFACGDTTHDTASLLRAAPHDRRRYPSSVFLWQAGDLRVLFDTGYAPEPWSRSPAVRAYRRALPPRIAPGEDVAARLRAAGIDPADITHVVLSHGHPDHIGGVRFFPDARFVLAAPLAALLDAPAPAPARLRAGVLRDLLPPWFADAERILVDRFDLAPPQFAGLRAADPLGDDRVLVVELPGHARGHIGLLLEGRVLLAADAAWGHDLLGREDELRRLPRLVAADRGALLRTAEALAAVHRSGIRVLFSHDAHDPDADLMREDAP